MVKMNTNMGEALLRRSVAKPNFSNTQAPPNVVPSARAKAAAPPSASPAITP